MGNTKFNIPQAVNPDSLTEQFQVLVNIIKILRIGCPWDNKQTNESIAHLLIEEAYETIDSIYTKNDTEFSKELGDLLLHIIMHAVMSEERGSFNLLDVIKSIQQKLVQRHPHVFGDVEVSGEDEVMENWEALKKKEGRKSVLDGVPDSLPSLLKAQRIQHKASRIGFDWDNKIGAWEKIGEELNELKSAIADKNNEAIREEFGDFLFSVVNAARFEDVAAEEALHLANKKFMSRFIYIEQKADELNRNLSDMSLIEMDELWEEAKKTEKKHKE